MTLAVQHRIVEAILRRVFWALRQPTVDFATAFRRRDLDRLAHKLGLGFHRISPFVLSPFPERLVATCNLMVALLAVPAEAAEITAIWEMKQLSRPTTCMSQPQQAKQDNDT